MINQIGHFPRPPETETSMNIQKLISETTTNIQKLISQDRTSKTLEDWE